MRRQVPLTLVLAVALVVVAAVGWLALIEPKQTRSAELDDRIAELETRLAVASRPATAKKPVVTIDLADVFRLAKAMPDRDDMPGMILEVNSIARATGVEFVAIQPGAATTKGSYYALPVTLTFEGNYYDLTDFLFRLRNLVSVRDGVLEASGRLYSLDSIEFQEGAGGFPAIRAILVVAAYSYGVPPAASAQPTTQTDTGGMTGPTTSESGPPADSTGNGNQQAAGASG
jgi:type IV pilus assembly PilO-like protein